MPLAADKKAAQAMLNQLVVKVERIMAGLVDPAEEHLARPLEGHLDDFHEYLKAKGNSRPHSNMTDDLLEVPRLFLNWKSSYENPERSPGEQNRRNHASPNVAQRER